jgi:flagellar basal-body rod protein FlgF
MLVILALLCCFVFYTNSGKSSNASYISLSGQLSNKTQIDILTNNLANSTTRGFIEDIPILGTKATKNKRLHFVQVKNVALSKQAFSFKKTARDLDIAISGPGYFKISVRDQDRFTLNGELQISNTGALVDRNGFSFLSQDGQEIFIPEEPGTILFSRDGEILKNKESLGKIGVFDISQSITKDENGYINALNSKLIEDCCILQGHLLESNVDQTKTMIEVLNLRNSLECNMNLLSNSFSMDKSAVETFKIRK